MPDKKEIKKLLDDFLDQQDSEYFKHVSDRLMTIAIDMNEFNSNLAKAIGIISKTTQTRALEVDDLEKSLKRYKDIAEGCRATMAQMNEERRRGLKIDEEAYQNAHQIYLQNQQNIAASERAIALKQKEQEGLLSESDSAYERKQWENYRSGKISQETYDMRMQARFGDNYSTGSGASLKERQAKVNDVANKVTTYTGSGGLGAMADDGINALSAAGPYGAAAAAVLKVVKAGIENILSRMDAAYKMLAKAIDEGNQIMLDNKAVVDTRLQGLENQFGEQGPFKEIVSNLLTAASNSGLINQKAYIENISKLVESGVAYNIEERAMLMTISDKIATTFDALDKSLTRLIRLQQADMTASALGREASLTEFLNRQFGDTSYMSDLYDNTSATLLEATSQMNIDQASSFMYAVQKWLGSLYALGMSQEAVGTIAQGLSYISTGNINALNSNQNMQTLFAMATENAGMSYSSMLTQGLDAEMVDTLMLSMVNYLGEIAKNTSNQVVKSQWADILNMTVSDLRAVSNLTEADMASLMGGNLGFNASVGHVSTVISDNMLSRYSTQELIKNILENVMFQAGMGFSMDDEEAMKYIVQSYAEQLMGKGSVFEDIGIWLQDTARLSKAGMLTEDFYKETYDRIKAMVLPGSMDNENGELYYDVSLDPFGTSLGMWDEETGRWVWGVNARGRESGWGSAEVQRQFDQLNLANWSSRTSVRNQNRGANFTGLTTAGVGSLGDLIWAMSDSTPYRTSVSRSSTVYTSAADSITKGFDAVESSATAITSANEEVTDQMEKLYNMLFESQSVPIKVFIEGYSDDFKEDSEELLGKINDELADRLEIALSNSSNSVYNMISTIQGLKGV